MSLQWNKHFEEFLNPAETSSRDPNTPPYPCSEVIKKLPSEKEPGVKEIRPEGVGHCGSVYAAVSCQVPAESQSGL